MKKLTVNGLIIRYLRTLMNTSQLRQPEIYPCSDVPTACDWTQPLLVCVYPNCWCAGWIVDSNIQKTECKGNSFKKIVYRGESELLADTVFQHLSSIKNENKLLALTHENCDVLRISGIEFIQMCGVYQVEIIGEIE